MERLSIGAKVQHPSFGEGVIFGINLNFIKVFFKEHGDKEIARDFDGLELIQEAEKPDNTLSIDDVKDALADVLQRYADFTVMIPLGDKWTGGKLVMQPGNPDLKSKEVPIEVFFHKIVMLRDRLRVLEQNINSNNKLTDEDKVNMQQYITRVYGSLTTFNILFKEERHQFKGEGGKD
jgi:hypothetical protein